ncbi:MAG: hypothetical protein KGI54_08400 [Pseudomonadota bacterium]|nr:hypothetical protein [Pseudomonadota bacterium]
MKPEDLKVYFSDNEKAIRKLKGSRRYASSTKKELCYIHRGAVSRDKFLKNLPALKELSEAVKIKVKSSGYLKGLDGRVLHVRSSHSALNTLLQSAGAILMKQALALLDRSLQEDHKLLPGEDYEFVANVHDEWQIECKEELADTVGKAAVASMETAGTLLKFRCPITGEYKSGKSWAETH